MIKSFSHKGLEIFFETGNTAGIQHGHRKKVHLQLVAPVTAHTIEDMEIPGFRLHSLKGKRKDQWAIDVSGNWRMTFRFEDENAYIVHSKTLGRSPESWLAMQANYNLWQTKKKINLKNVQRLNLSVA